MMPISAIAMIAIHSTVRDFGRPELATMSAPPPAEIPVPYGDMSGRTDRDRASRGGPSHFHPTIAESRVMGVFAPTAGRSSHRRPTSCDGRSRYRPVGILAAAALLTLVSGGTVADHHSTADTQTRNPAGRPAPASTPAAPAAYDLPAAPAPASLPVLDYGPPPAGFPPDRASASTAPLKAGLRPYRRVVAYDAPGGRPRAFLPPTILGVPVTVPIVDWRASWTAVLVPSANRRIAWVPSGGWTEVPLRDLLVVARRAHRLTWWRDGQPVRSWQVSLGHPRTPTPLGRTFVLGRSTLRSHVYADTDVFALGAVPDDPDAVSPGLRGAHIGLHTWYHDRELGQNTTDGCIRVTRPAQRKLLDELVPGTPLVVVEKH
jgi:lipoprotein-anchoring transpeptidase ErfK/SrfK